MGKWHPFENLRVNLMNNPPVVVFVLCMALMAAAFIGFGAYTKKHDVRDPDVAQDWNEILSSLATLTLCALDTDTEGKVTSVGVQHIGKSLLLEHEAAGEVPANYSHWFLLVPLVLSGSTPKQHPASFNMALRGSLLGLKGPAGKAILNLTLHFLTERELNASHAGAGSSLGSTCLRVIAPAHVVPQTRMPPLCPASEEPYADHSVVTAMTSRQYKQDAQSAEPCYHMEFNPDPELVVMLSQEDRDLAVHHLMMVAGCLLSLCAVLCFAGSFSFSKSRKYHSNGLDLQKLAYFTLTSILPALYRFMLELRLEAEKGSSVTAEHFMLPVGQAIVNGHITNFCNALLMFAVQYCLDISYPLAFSATMEFLHRCLFKIDPDRGSKVEQSMTKKLPVVNPKFCP